MDFDLSKNRNLKQIQNLGTRLEYPDSLQQKISLYAELAWELMISEPERAETLARETIKMAQSGSFLDMPFMEGQAAGKVTLGFIQTHAGHLKEGAENCLNALNSIENPQTSRTTTRA